MHHSGRKRICILTIHFAWDRTGESAHVFRQNFMDQLDQSSGGTAAVAACGVFQNQLHKMPRLPDADVLHIGLFRGAGVIGQSQSQSGSAMETAKAAVRLVLVSMGTCRTYSNRF